jgi:predicted RNA-binding protein YlqC (UPF0109 family)
VSERDEQVDDFDDEDDDFEDGDDFEDEVGGEGNRIVGARARAVVEHVARALVEDPEGVHVDASEQRGQVTLLVHASPGDMGRLIGKRGRVIQAVRQLARAAAASEGTRATVDVAD